jgi:hypothetical protein
VASGSPRRPWPGAKSTAATVLVIAMVVVSAFGTYLQILGSVNIHPSRLRPPGTVLGAQENNIHCCKSVNPYKTYFGAQIRFSGAQSRAQVNMTWDCAAVGS